MCSSTAYRVAAIQLIYPLEDLSARTVFVHGPSSKSDPEEIANGPSDLAKAKIAAAKVGIFTDPMPVAVIPADQDAAPLYNQWYSMFHPKLNAAPMYMDPLRSTYNYTPDQLAAAQKLENDNSAAGATLDQALSKPSCTCAASASGGSEMFTRLRAAAREIMARSTLLALSGYRNDAFAMQVKGFTVDRQCTQTKGFIPYMVALAIDRLTLAVAAIDDRPMLRRLEIKNRIDLRLRPAGRNCFTFTSR